MSMVSSEPWPLLSIPWSDALLELPGLRRPPSVRSPCSVSRRRRWRSLAQSGLFALPEQHVGHRDRALVIGRHHVGQRWPDHDARDREPPPSARARRRAPPTACAAAPRTAPPAPASAALRRSVAPRSGTAARTVALPAVGPVVTAHATHHLHHHDHHQDAERRIPPSGARQRTRARSRPVRSGAHCG